MSESDNPDYSKGMDEGGEETDLPPMGVMAMVLVALILCAVFGLRVYSFSNPIFLLNQQAINICFLIVLSFFYGMVTYRLPETSAFRTYQTLFLPTLLIVAMWLKTYIIYSSNLYAFCPRGDDAEVSPFRWRVLLWNTAKPCIAILVTFLFVTLFGWTLTPFFELFNSAHPLVYFVGIGFWTGCATWAAEASAFFELQRAGCSPTANIKFSDYHSSKEEQSFDPFDPPTQIKEQPPTEV